MHQHYIILSNFSIIKGNTSLSLKWQKNGVIKRRATGFNSWQRCYKCFS